MQFRTVFAFTLMATVLVGTQVQGQSYPWRADSGQSVSGDRNRTGVSRAQRRNGRQPILVSFGENQEDQKPGAQSVLSDAQPSVSDMPADQPAVIQKDDVPVAPQAEAKSLIDPSTSPQDWAGTDPSLMVASNAGDKPNYCNRNCRKPCCLGCERKLFGRTPNGLELGGWTNVGYHNRSNGLLNNRNPDINLHQAWFYMDRQANRDTSAWSFGFRTDLVYGLDGQDLQSFGNDPTGAPSGWDNSWDYGSFGWALPQAYVQMANCNWDVKLGKFLSPFGYEKIGARDNFFYSHSFTSILIEPQTFSGVLGERRVSANRSVLIGATAGWDTGFDNNDGGNLILGMRSQPNEFVNLSFTASAGDTGYRDTGIFTSGVTQVLLTDQLSYVLQIDNLNLRTNQEFGVVQYLFRDINPCFGLGARMEWWKSDRFFGGGNRSTYSFTMGANYRFNANLRIRPELRFDWGALAVDPGEAIIGIDAVMTF